MPRRPQTRLRRDSDTLQAGLGAPWACFARDLGATWACFAGVLGASRVRRPGLGLGERGG